MTTQPLAKADSAPLTPSGMIEPPRAKVGDDGSVFLDLAPGRDVLASAVTA